MCQRTLKTYNLFPNCIGKTKPSTKLGPCTTYDPMKDAVKPCDLASARGSYCEVITTVSFASSRNRCGNCPRHRDGKIIEEVKGKDGDAGA